MSDAHLLVELDNPYAHKDYQTGWNNE